MLQHVDGIIPAIFSGSGEIRSTIESGSWLAFIPFQLPMIVDRPKFIGNPLYL